MEKIRDEARVSLLEEFIDRGEAEAIVLALDFGANPLLIDEREARGLGSPLYVFLYVWSSAHLFLPLLDGFHPSLGRRSPLASGDANLYLNVLKQKY